MHRWWQRRGRRATIAELQRALDACRIAYIPEEFRDRHSTFIAYTDTEDDLDVGQVGPVLAVSVVPVSSTSVGGSVGSRVVSVLDSGAVGPGFKSQS